MSLVLDASVTLAWCLDDETSAYADTVLDGLARSEATVASPWGLDVSNGLLTAERHGRIAADEGPKLTSWILSLPIAVDPVSRSRALTATHRLARTHGLTSYDAAYLELAVRYGQPLATLDQELAAAAEREGVRLWVGAA